MLNPERRTFRMLGFIVLGWTLLSEATIGASANPVTKSGYVGESVEIQCSYQFASTNPKYFCRDPCTENKHMLIKSDQSNPSYTGRYRLKDYGKGVFYVTITDLQKSDTGTYWCGVHRLVTDTFSKVFLTVKDARPPHRTDPPRPPAPAPERTSTSSTSIIPSSTSPTIPSSTPPTIPSSTSPTILSSKTTTTVNFSSLSKVPSGSVGERTPLLYAGGGLGGAVIVLGLSLVALLMCRRTFNKSQGPVSSNSIYAEVKKPKKNQTNIPTSFTAQSDEETLENPLYDTMELEETVYSHIYATAQ